MPAPRLLVLADDLSGAAEAAATLGAPVPVLLAHDAPPGDGDLALDLDCRYAPAGTAHRRTAAALTAGATAADTVALLKIDSLLRGNVTAQLAAAIAADGGPVVLAPALPEHGRTVVGGVPLVDGVPLADMPAWRVEGRPAPRHLGDLCPEPAVHLDLGTVRGGRATAALQGVRIATCDAETADDLRHVVRAVANAGGTLVGSAGLARAWAAARPPAARADAEPASPSGSTVPCRTVPCLTVLGTAAPGIAAQVARLDAAFPQTLLDVPAAEVARWADDPAARQAQAGRVARALADGADVTVRMTDTGAPVDPRIPPGQLGDLVAGALDGAGPADLVASGGETARSALSRIGVRRLEVLAEIHPGAVLSRGDAAHGSYVVTRPGGQGGVDSLVLVREALLHRRAGARPATHTLEKNR